MEGDRRTRRSLPAERAITPVVGASILVGIVVVLATVLGVFTLGIVDQKPTTPVAKLTIDQEAKSMITLKCSPPSACSPLRDKFLTLELVHQAGDGIMSDNLGVWVDSSDSQLNLQNEGSVYDIESHGSCCEDKWNPVLEDVDDSRFRGGDSVQMAFYGVSKDQIKNKNITDYDVLDEGPFSPQGDQYEIGIGTIARSNGPGAIVGQEFRRGDQVMLVWSPDGQDRTQLIREYTVS